MTDDFACPTIVQRRTHDRAGHTIEMTGCHSPFLSKPAEAAGVVTDIMGGVSSNRPRRKA